MDTLTNIEEINEALNAVKEKVDEPVDQSSEEIIEAVNKDISEKAVAEVAEDVPEEAVTEVVEDTVENTDEEKEFSYLPAETKIVLPDQDTLIKTALIIGIAALGSILFANRKSIVSGVKKVMSSRPASFARKALERDTESEEVKGKKSLKDTLNGIIEKLDSLKRTFESITNFFTRKKD